MGIHLRNIALTGALALAALPAAALPKGTSFSVDNIFYEVISEADRTARITSVNNKSKLPANLVIDKVKYARPVEGAEEEEFTVTEISAKAFSQAENIETLKVGNSVTTIGESTFYCCTSLAKVELGSGLTALANSLFSGCEALKEVDIANGPESIGEWTFADCPFTSINLPNSVRTIGDNAFYGCTSLESLTIGESLESIGAWTFDDCSSLAKIQVSSTNPHLCALDNVLYTKDVTELVFYPMGKGEGEFKVPASVEVIRSFSIMKNTFLISVSLSWNLKRIDNYAFEGCNAIRVVSCNTYAPPVCRAYFSTGTTKDGTLVVPVGSKTDYEMTGGWKDFKNIIESSAGIAESEADSITARAVGGTIIIDGCGDNALIEVYDMAGKCAYRGTATTVSGLDHGIYMVHIGSMAVKVAV